jgi:predicted NAD/FAD-dependent oxidoreductase
VRDPRAQEGNEVTAASPRIAVIGAGIAGIAAACELQANGIAVQLFDKGRAAGGRVATRRRDDAQFDHGAQFFTVRDDGFAAAIAPLVRDGAVAEWRGPFRTLRAGEFGPDPRPGVRYVGVPGMSALPRMLCGDFAAMTNARVVALRRASNAWHLDVERDGSVQTHAQAFDALLLAIPPAQAMDLLAASRIDGVAFHAAQRAQQLFDQLLPGRDVPYEICFCTFLFLREVRKLEPRKVKSSQVKSLDFDFTTDLNGTVLRCPLFVCRRRGAHTMYLHRTLSRLTENQVNLHSTISITSHGG